MKKTRYLIAAIFLFRMSYSQLQYGGMQQLGLSFNQDGTTAHIAIINGVRFGNYFVGVGANPHFETFRWRTAALYADGRYYIGQNKRFFGKIDAGVNLITERTRGSSYWDWGWKQASYRKQPGFHGVIGAGFKARLGKEVFYSFDISYGFTQMRYTESFLNFLGEEQTTRYDLRRTAIVLQLGIELL